LEDALRGSREREASLEQRLAATSSVQTDADADNNNDTDAIQVARLQEELAAAAAEASALRDALAAQEAARERYEATIRALQLSEELTSVPLDGGALDGLDDDGTAPEPAPAAAAAAAAVVDEEEVVQRLRPAVEAALREELEAEKEAFVDDVQRAYEEEREAARAQLKASMEEYGAQLQEGFAAERRGWGEQVEEYRAAADAAARQAADAAEALAAAEAAAARAAAELSDAQAELESTRADLQAQDEVESALRDQLTTLREVAAQHSTGSASREEALLMEAADLRRQLDDARRCRFRPYLIPI
jgi:hypothetical protein